MGYHEKICRKDTLLLIVLVSITLVFALLIYSLSSQYRYLSRIVFTSYNESLNSAINQYRSYCFNKIGVDTILVEVSDFASSQNDLHNTEIDEVMYNINSRFVSLTSFEIQKLDSIYLSILKEKQIESKYNIAVFKHDSDSILEQSLVQENMSYKFQTIRKELDSERDVQIYFTNPVGLVLNKMMFSFVFSFVMFVAIMIALVYQFRIIDRQKKIEAIRRNFIDSMTHELRHPLQGALSLSEILNNEKIAKDNSLRNNMIERLKSNLQSLETLLSSLVVQSYSEQLQSVAHWTQGDLKNCIDEIITTCLLSNKKIIHFNFNYSDEIMNCWFDPIHFPNAIKNLVENAIKYSSNEVDIEIRAIVQNAFVEVSIRDNGIGISKEDMPHIFEKFYKGCSGAQNHGFGLGLSYVKWVCEIHGGEVNVLSIVDKGSIFKLIIPLYNP
jgi:two-component system phosphate regulon sensor histidine kinase PhoR